MVKESADRSAWALCGISGETLFERGLSGADHVIDAGEAHTTYQYKDTSIHYRIVDTFFSPGMRLDCVWDDAQQD